MQNFEFIMGEVKNRAQAFSLVIPETSPTPKEVFTLQSKQDLSPRGHLGPACVVYHQW